MEKGENLNKKRNDVSLSTHCNCRMGRLVFDSGVELSSLLWERVANGQKGSVQCLPVLCWESAGQLVPRALAVQP